MYLTISFIVNNSTKLTSTRSSTRNKAKTTPVEQEVQNVSVNLQIVIKKYNKRS